MNLSSPNKEEFDKIVGDFVEKYVEPRLKAQMPDWNVNVGAVLAYEQSREDVDTGTISISASAWLYPKGRRKRCQCLFKGGIYGSNRVLLLRCNYIRFMQASNQKISERQRSLQYLLRRCQPLFADEWADPNNALARKKRKT